MCSRRLFPEALTELSQYEVFTRAFPSTPVLANITEFGKTPLFSQDDLAACGVSILLNPLSACRAASAAALKVYQQSLKDGHQRAVVDSMQTREDLYRFLDYHRFEQELDRLFGEKKGGAGAK